MQKPNKKANTNPKKHTKGRRASYAHKGISLNQLLKRLNFIMTNMPDYY
jgi:hypothetical protein